MARITQIPPSLATDWLAQTSPQFSEPTVIMARPKETQMTAMRAVGYVRQCMLDLQRGRR